MDVIVDCTIVLMQVVTLVFCLDPGMPGHLTSQQLQKALQNVASSTISARHPGPRRDPQEPIEQLAEQGTGGSQTQQYYSQVPPRVNSGYYTNNFRSEDDEPSIRIGREGRESPKDTRELWEASCSRCTWKKTTRDPTVVTGLAALLKVHMEYEHGPGKVVESADESSRDNEEFVMATTPQVVP